MIDQNDYNFKISEIILSFKLCHEVHAFFDILIWNTLISIDIVWLDFYPLGLFHSNLKLFACFLEHF